LLLIDDLLMLPLKGFWGVFKRIHGMVEQELCDETYLREKLMTLRLRFELGEISEEEYSKGETELLAQLDAVRGIDE